MCVVYTHIYVDVAKTQTHFMHSLLRNQRLFMHSHTSSPFSSPSLFLTCPYKLHAERRRGRLQSIDYAQFY